MASYAHEALQAHPPLALTMGDPAGIGPDITLKSWIMREDHNLPAFFVLADITCLQERQKCLDITIPILQIANPSEALSVFSKALPVLPVALKTEIQAGIGNTDTAAAILQSIEQAVAFTQNGNALGVVTNPINKHILYESGFSFPGHTEFLCALAQKENPTYRGHSIMMLVADDLRVVPITIHIPLKQVTERLTSQLIVETARCVASDLNRFFGLSSPRLAITGLNPHAGEDGALGSEEQDIIIPAINTLKAEGLSVSGPHPADTIFHAEARKTYDVVLAMYHDQALIPVKTIGFDRGVNITLSLPFVRTSPDHGTAYDIAGTGKANPRSLIEAIKLAHQMAHHAQQGGET